MSQTGTNWANATRLKTRQLSLLLELAEHGSVLRAAQAASMTQPAASKLLAEMESLLGVKLFERHARGVEPTWYGQVLVRHARTALTELSRAHDEIAAEDAFVEWGEGGDLCFELVIPAEHLGRSGERHDLHRRPRHHQLAGIQRVHIVARAGRPDEHAPERAIELR